MAKGVLSFVTVVTIAAASVTFASPASADVVTVCGGTGQNARANVLELPSMRPFAAFALATVPALSPDGQIALAQDASGYDLVVNWGGEGERSLRTSGADIRSLGLGPEIVHLIVTSAPEAVEQHFLFSLSETGEGDLLWGSDDAPEGADLNRATCRKR